MKYRDVKARSTLEALSRLKSFSVLPYPPVMLTADEENRLAAIQDGLSRYAEETMARFVTGDIELTDENWQQFRETAEAKGLQEMIAIWQKALDR